MVRQESNVPQGGVQAPIYVADPRLTSLQIKQATIEELQKNDVYWRSRLEKLTEKQLRMDEVMKEEERRAVNIF